MERVEVREYDKYQSCALCGHPVKKCIFYRCKCGHITFKLCEDCSKPTKTKYINLCPFCTTKEDEDKKLDFSLLLPFK